MALRFRLIPRNEDFYVQFIALAEQLRIGPSCSNGCSRTEPIIWDKVDEIKEVEHKCDHLTHQIIQRLNSTFVTPIDPEDIHALAKSLDDVMDAIDASARFVRLYKISTNLFGARELARVISLSVDQVRLALEALEKQSGGRRTRGRDQQAGERGRSHP